MRAAMAKCMVYQSAWYDQDPHLICRTTPAPPLPTRSPDLRLQGIPVLVHVPIEVAQVNKLLEALGVAQRVDGEAEDGLDSAGGPKVG
jgi:hypothetical protein